MIDALHRKVDTCKKNEEVQTLSVFFAGGDSGNVNGGDFDGGVGLQIL